ncbi:hypothetical protein GH714_030215 [Hevea brasiliensis]|uniref:Retrotransposon gag domain-containing protein n=1 Tax=Hevea brasiliensis TaxID=3981 RepID=A0A6A6MQM0_HEVBR|nr:hypothetical protein GH714_030215 [Hevea brasiliensis]
MMEDMQPQDLVQRFTIMMQQLEQRQEGDSTRAKEDSLEDLRNLKQEFNLQDYWNSFNKLYSKARVQEEQALNFFLNGLVDELQLVVRMFKLKTIADAYNLAKLQELTVATILHKSKPSTKPTTFVKAEIEVLKFDEGGKISNLSLDSTDEKISYA